MTAHRLQSAAAALLLGVGLAGADAAVYRCGNAYADVPCPQARVIDADDARSDADRAAAHDVAQREAMLASRMVADRERAERLLLRPVAVTRVRAPARAASAAAPQRSSRDRLRVDADGNFIAIVRRKR